MKALLRRIEVLEQRMCPVSDAEIVAWGSTVTDAELQRLIGEVEQFLREQPSGGQDETIAPPMSEAAMWRVVQPFIEELRAQDSGRVS